MHQLSRYLLMFCTIAAFSALFYYCGSDSPRTKQPQKEAAAQATAAPSKYITTKTGKKILRSEKGITVVRPDGWTSQEMDFQIGYCAQMMASVTDIDGLKYCECFLERIQYYYEPIHAREAYDDQSKWNQECYQESMK